MHGKYRKSHVLRGLNIVLMQKEKKLGQTYRNSAERGTKLLSNTIKYTIWYERNISPVLLECKIMSMQRKSRSFMFYKSERSEQLLFICKFSLQNEVRQVLFAVSVRMLPPVKRRSGHYCKEIAIWFSTVSKYCKRVGRRKDIHPYM